MILRIEDTRVAEELNKKKEEIMISSDGMHSIWTEMFM